MVKRNNPWWKNPTIVISIIAGLGVLGTFTVKLAKFITVVDAVEAAEKKIESVKEEVDTIKDYIGQQQAINEYYYNKEKKEEQVMISPDGKFWWDKETKTWKPIKK